MLGAVRRVANRVRNLVSRGVFLRGQAVDTRFGSWAAAYCPRRRTWSRGVYTSALPQERRDQWSEHCPTGFPEEPPKEPSGLA